MAYARSLFAGLFVAAFLVALFAAGCGNGALPPVDDAPDLAAPPDLAPAPPDLSLPPRPPTDHPLPTQVTNHGGRSLDREAVWTVVWPGDEQLGAEVDAFHAWMLGSDYWTQSLAEYGVGAGVANGVIVMPMPAPPQIDYTQFDTFVAQLSAQPQYAADRNTLFAFIVPATTTVTSTAGNGCDAFGGYHSETAGGVVYSVNLQCDFFGGGWSGLTVVLSHEQAEAATDAHPLTSLPGWYSDDFFPSEIGDLCTGLNDTVAVPPPNADAGVPDGGALAPTSYTVSRLYSAKIAAAGNADPCLPAPDVPYFGAAIAPITVTTDDTGAGTATAEVEPFAYGDVGQIKWTIYAQITGVIFSTLKGSSNAGDTIPLTVTVTPASSYGTFPIEIYAVAKNGRANLWFSSVTIQ